MIFTIIIQYYTTNCRKKVKKELKCRKKHLNSENKEYFMGAVITTLQAVAAKLAPGCCVAGRFERGILFKRQ